MSVYFSKIIKAGDRNREFNFTRLPHRSSTQYSVDVPDERGNRISFTMHQEEGVWKASLDILPPWVLNAEEELSKAIEEENKASTEKEGRHK